MMNFGIYNDELCVQKHGTFVFKMMNFADAAAATHTPSSPLSEATARNVIHFIILKCIIHHF